MPYQKDGVAAEFVPNKRRLHLRGHAPAKDINPQQLVEEAIREQLAPLEKKVEGLSKATYDAHGAIGVFAKMFVEIESKATLAASNEGSSKAILQELLESLSVFSSYTDAACPLVTKAMDHARAAAPAIQLLRAHRTYRGVDEESISQLFSEDDLVGGEFMAHEGDLPFSRRRSGG